MEEHEDSPRGRTAHHYNFVKPHMALEGQTPAQRAKVGVQGSKWLTLLSAAAWTGPKLAETMN